ncbi:LysE family translocator [Orrella daihaiensis]|uniref:LysE family translocator n=1 Tax=Orrella daihaiensis TaxID=2782176 RepID=A0ABY4AIZ5_9BURK|nr:LysE family translocator [Orrella daihaiensis]UOD50264.1 LysE family translocator [Orrella daihaiensis]
MIDFPSLLAFVAAATILALTPGVDTAIVLNTAVSQGRQPALMAALGICLGCLLWGTAVSFGLGAVIAASEAAYTTLKYAGALYLLWLGIRLLFRPYSPSLSHASVEHDFSSSRAFGKGLMVNVLNPKIGIFYVTFLPQFVPNGTEVAAYSLGLAAIHVMVSMLWFCALIVATVPLERFLKRPSILKTLDRITGSIFVIFAFRLTA